MLIVSPQDCWVAGEIPFPQGLRDHARHRIRRAFVLRRENPSVESRHAEHFEEVARDDLSVNPFGRPSQRDVERLSVRRGHIHEDVGPCAPFFEADTRDRVTPPLHDGHRREDSDDALIRADWQRPKQDGVDDRVDRGGDPDVESQGKDRGRCRTRTSTQETSRVANVGQQDTSSNHGSPSARIVPARGIVTGVLCVISTR